MARASRMVKIIMRPRVRSISGARQVVHGTESCLHARLPGWIAEKAGRYPYPDDCAPDDKQNPQSARRNNFPGEQISRWFQFRLFQLLSENLSASNYPGAADNGPHTR